MTYEIAFALIGLTGIAASVRAVFKDGYRRTPTNPRAARR